MAILSKRKFAALCLSAVFVTGCSSTSVKVVRNPDEGDNGVRFYRPKPYLLVTPADPTGRLVNMKLEYLPDFNEEYSAHLKGKASVALKDGWNLVGVNTKEAPKEKDEPPAKIEDIKLPAAVVSATNVPIGYYESVYGYAGEKKFLQGWRYVGMTMLGGGQPNVCRVAGHNPNCPPGAAGTNGCISGPLYGLVFFNGVMTFRQLDEIANNQLCPMYVNPTPAEPAPVGPPQGSQIETGTPQPKPAIESGTPANSPKIESAPPLPNPSPGSASLSRPKVTPTLVVVKPAATSPSISKPAAPAVASAKPAASPSTYVPLARKTAVAAPATANVPLQTAASKNVPLQTAASKKVAAPTTGFDQDPLMATPPSLDQDLFRTGSSPNR